MRKHRPKAALGLCKESAQVLARLAPRQARQTVSVLRQKRAHRLGPGAGMVAQRPANGFTDEKVALVGQRQRVAEQPRLVGVRLPAQLVQHGHAAHPQVGVAQARIHGALHIRLVRACT